MTSSATPLAKVWFSNAVAVLAVGSFTLFVAFFVSYAFRDDVGWFEHGSFLVLATGSALMCGLMFGSQDARVLQVRRRTGIAFALTVSASLHLAAVGIGTIVSLANEDQGSVTADQPNGPFVAVVLLALVLAAAAARLSIHLVRDRPTLTS